MSKPGSVSRSVASWFRAAIKAVYWTSPYRWLDYRLELFQKAQPDGSAERDRWLDRRYALSDFYITGWFLAAIVFYINHELLPYWLVLPLCLRAFGILNKELGVILFGICKVTEGLAVSASERVLTLALINYMTAFFVFATLHGMVGGFEGPSSDLFGVPLLPLYQAGGIHFGLSPGFEPETNGAHALALFHSSFSFFYATIIIALFVSLLTIETLDEND